MTAPPAPDNNRPALKLLAMAAGVAYVQGFTIPVEVLLLTQSSGALGLFFYLAVLLFMGAVTGSLAALVAVVVFGLAWKSASLRGVTAGLLLGCLLGWGIGIALWMAFGTGTLEDRRLCHLMAALTGTASGYWSAWLSNCN